MNRFRAQAWLVAIIACAIPACAQTSLNHSAAASQLLVRAKETKSSYIAVSYGDQTVLRVGGDDPTETWSVTKSMCGVALEILRQSGKIASFDVQLRKYFPVWAHDSRGSITLRQVMDQTSGLEADKPTSYPVKGDIVKQSLTLKLIGVPGTRFEYNKVATNLLSGVIRRASGMSPDGLLHRTLFSELGVGYYYWMTDSAGNNPCYAGLSMRGDDLLRIGELIEGDRPPLSTLNTHDCINEISSERVVGRPDYGLLWWKARASQTMTLDTVTLNLWMKGRVLDDAAKRLAPMRGKVLSEDAYFSEIRRRLGNDQTDRFFNLLENRGLPFGSLRESGPLAWIMARGSAGQYLVIDPASNGVVIRQSLENPSTGNTFDDLVELGQAVLRACSAYPMSKCSA